MQRNVPTAPARWNILGGPWAVAHESGNQIGTSTAPVRRSGLGRAVDIVTVQKVAASGGGSQQQEAESWLAGISARVTSSRIRDYSIASRAFQSAQSGTSMHN